MDFGANGKSAPRRCLLDLPYQVVGRANAVGLLADLPTALGVHDNLHARVIGPNSVHMFGKKTLVHRTVALPQDDLRLAHAVGAEAALQLVRVPHRHLVERNAACKAGVASKVLVRQEEELLVATEGPIKSALGV